MSSMEGQRGTHVSLPFGDLMVDHTSPLDMLSTNSPAALGHLL